MSAMIIVKYCKAIYVMPIYKAVINDLLYTIKITSQSPYDFGKKIILFLFLHVWGHTWRTFRSWFSLHYMGPRDRMKVIKLGGKHP